MAEDAPGFFGRWSRRKTEVLQGKPLQEPLQAPLLPTRVGPPVINPSAPSAGMPHALASHPAAPSESESESPAGTPEKTLSLDDVRQLTQDSDFKPFAARGVAPEVRNAAMKKLFADPHYNVMDGLDIYIDDYSQPDPIPLAMLRQMTGARLLKIFDDPGEVNEVDGAVDADSEKALAQPGSIQASTEAAPTPAASLNNPTPQTVAQSAESSAPTRPDTRNSETLSQPRPFEGPGASQHDHADPHLRLQPDHASPAPSAGRGTS